MIVSAYRSFVCIQEKRHWRRYIYLWISYAVYEELNCDDVERTREVYKVCLDLIPHKIFTFAKIWIMAAQFEVRQKNLAKAREILVCDQHFCNRLERCRIF